jgi:hypothetical protein
MKLPILPLTLLVVAGLWIVSGATWPAAPASALQGKGKGKYDTNSLKGAHGFSYSGSIDGMGAVASSGRIDFDGKGGVEAVFTTSVGGLPFTGSFEGTYTVNTDGTGSVVVDLPWLGVKSGGDFVIVDHGDGTFFTSTETGYSVTGSTRRL